MAREFIGIDAPKYPEIEVALVGEDGNAVAIMGRVSNACLLYTSDAADE